MSDSAVALAIYAGIGLLVAVVIFVTALRLANAAKRGNVRFARRQRAERDDARRREHGDDGSGALNEKKGSADE
ncbi:MAG: hypothetical protein LOD94_02545 [Gammaproteobacteria bacterium]|nr:hypothetical protein [Gammaproteobacteria bacterium]